MGKRENGGFAYRAHVQSKTRDIPPASILSRFLRGGEKGDGAPSTTRTCDLCLRRAALYPTELWVQNLWAH